MPILGERESGSWTASRYIGGVGDYALRLGIVRGVISVAGVSLNSVNTWNRAISFFFWMCASSACTSWATKVLVRSIIFCLGEI